MSKSKSDKTGLLLGGLLLTVGAGVGIYYLVRDNSSEATRGIGLLSDWNSQTVSDWRLQQMKLARQRQGVPQIY